MAGDFPKGAAVVVGGSGGIGSAIVGRLAESKADVVVAYRRNAEAAEEAARRARAHQVHASVHQVELGDIESVRALFQAARAEYGAVHTIVNAAGSAIDQPFISRVTPERWREVIDTDVHGFFNVVHASLPLLREQGGSYVFLSSAGLERYPAGDILSVAPKAAIEALIRGIAREEGRYGIRANSVAIGVVNAGMFSRLVRDGHLTQAWLDAARRNIALRRFGTEQEVADAVAFLASTRASYITGQRLLLDGGYSL